MALPVRGSAHCSLIYVRPNSPESRPLSKNFLTARTSSFRPSSSKASYGQSWILAHKGSFPSGCGGGGRTDYKNFKAPISSQIYMHSSLFWSHLLHPVPIRLWTCFKLKWTSFLTPITPSNGSSPYARFILNVKLIFIASFSFCVTLHRNLT